MIQKVSHDESSIITLFIGGFPSSTTEGIVGSSDPVEILTEYFEDYKSLVSITIVKNKNKNSKGFGYIKFAQNSDAEKAIRLRHKISGKMVFPSFLSC